MSTQTSKQQQAASIKEICTSLSSLVWNSPQPIQDQSNSVELAQVEKGAGFADPFDELASARVLPPSSSPPQGSHSQACLVLQSSQGSLCGDNTQEDLLGASHVSSTHNSSSSKHHPSCSQPQPELWPWAAFDDLDEPPCLQEPSQQQHQPQACNGRQSVGGTSSYQQGTPHCSQGPPQQRQGNPRTRSLHTTSEGSLHSSQQRRQGSSNRSSNIQLAARSPDNQTMQRVQSADNVEQGKAVGSTSDTQDTQDRDMQGDAQGVQGPGEAFLRHRSQVNGAEDVRELFIFAIPLTKERLVFLPVAGWTENPKQEQEGLRGLISAGATNLRDRIKKYWKEMGTKDPDTFQHRMYTHGKSVLENMSAEERLMRNIPKTATKVIVYHPTSVMPSTVQDQLTNMTSTYCIRSAGKAAAAGILLPVAVGIECVAVPGAGWFTLYQLYKASVGSQGGNRLKGYLNHDDNVRVCYAGDERLNKYVERLSTCPDGILAQDDVDDLVHELEQPQLLHPLSELRNRYLKRLRHKGEGDYELLPASAEDDEEDEDALPKPPAPAPKRGWLW